MSGYTYASQSSDVLLQDFFNDDCIDTSKWTANDLFTGFSDLSVPINQTSQRLEIGPLLQATSGSHYRGIRSQNSYDFTGAFAQVELVEPASAATKADAMFTVGYSVDNLYRFYVSEGVLIGQKKIGGIKTTFLTLSYDPTNHRFLRIRHDATTNRVVFETAPAAGRGIGTFTERYSETWNSAVQLTTIRI